MDTKEIIVPEALREHWDEQITNGMAFLDAYFEGPEWVDMIDLDRLDLNDGSTCICGQLFDPVTGERTVTEADDEDVTGMDGYDYALHHVIEHGSGDDYGVTSRKARQYGFLLGHGPYDDIEVDLDEVVIEHNTHLTDDDYFEISYNKETGMNGVWELFTRQWADRIRKRRAELGSMA